MRPLLFGTDSKQQLRISADLLRGFGVTRSQRARAVYHEPFIPAPPQAEAPRQHAPLPAELKTQIRRIRIQAWTRQGLIGIGAVAFLVGASWLLQVAPRGWYDPHQHALELQAQQQWRIEHPLVYDRDSPRPQIALRAVPLRSSGSTRPRVQPTALALTTYLWRNVAPYGELQLHIIGRLPSTADLPDSGQLGDAYLIGDHYWCWAKPSWSGLETWCDP